MIEILLVEDNPTDVLLVREALARSALESRLSTIDDGAALLPFLRREGGHAGAPRPDLILLDLNLPNRHGLDALEELKADEDLRRIPVLVLSISTDRQDIERAYDLQASCFITKPPDFTQLVAIADAVKRLWGDGPRSRT